jgi:hypothetical protein
MWSKLTNREKCIEINALRHLVILRTSANKAYHEALSARGQTHAAEWLGKQRSAVNI